MAALDTVEDRQAGPDMTDLSQKPVPRVAKKRDPKCICASETCQIVDFSVIEETDRLGKA